MYTNQAHLATVHFGLASLSFSIFSLGLSVGVVIAVGMLLYFQVGLIASNSIWRIASNQFKCFVHTYFLCSWLRFVQLCAIVPASKIG